MSIQTSYRQNSDWFQKSMNNFYPFTIWKWAVFYPQPRHAPGMGTQSETCGWFSNFLRKAVKKAFSRQNWRGQDHLTENWLVLPTLIVDNQQIRIWLSFSFMIFTIIDDILNLLHRLLKMAHLVQWFTELKDGNFPLCKRLPESNGKLPTVGWDWDSHGMGEHPRDG